MNQNTHRKRRGFTIVELLIVIAIIGILAAIVIVAYNGIANRANSSSAQSASSDAYKKVVAYMVTNSDQTPPDLATAGILGSNSTSFQYSNNTATNPQTFCITATVNSVSYYIDNASHTSPTTGICPGQVVGPGIANGSFIQDITSSNCPATRTRAVDARDNHTYWVQKLADGKCWMLTNLAYAGGGTNTYSDVKPLTNATGGSGSYSVPSYYVSSSANVTSEPTSPSISTDGGATNPQYGYLYNWCGAMGNQSTAACSNSTTPTPDTTTSICPAGWRLPTGNGNDFSALNAAVNGGSTTTDAGLRANWLAQRGGYWYYGFGGLGTDSHYWSAMQTTASLAYKMFFQSSVVYTNDNSYKYQGFAVRCLAV